MGVAEDTLGVIILSLERKTFMLPSEQNPLASKVTKQMVRLGRKKSRRYRVARAIVFFAATSVSAVILYQVYANGLSQNLGLPLFE